MAARPKREKKSGTAYPLVLWVDVDAIAPLVDGKFFSAFIRARKPSVAAPCCGPSCCS